MTLLDQLKADHVAITQILAGHSNLQVGEGRVGLATLHSIYLHILRDALSTLNSLITYLES